LILCVCWPRRFIVILEPILGVLVGSNTWESFACEHSALDLKLWVSFSLLESPEMAVGAGGAKDITPPDLALLLFVVFHSLIQGGSRRVGDSDVRLGSVVRARCRGRALNISADLSASPFLCFGGGHGAGS